MIKVTYKVFCENKYECKVTFDLNMPKEAMRAIILEYIPRLKGKDLSLEFVYSFIS